MSIKGLEAQRNYPLNKKLKEIFWGSWCMQTNCGTMSRKRTHKIDKF